MIAVCAALAAALLTGTFGWFGEPTASAEEASQTPEIVDGRVTNYLYFTNFETFDPGLTTGEPSGCAGKYYSEWEGHYSCISPSHLSGDRIEGPYHTNDAARVEGSAEFGQAGADPPDTVEIYGGTYPEDRHGQCTGMPIFHTATHCYVRGERIPLPDDTTGLSEFVEREDTFSGETRLELNGTANTIRVVNFNASGGEYDETVEWPKNGLIYVQSNRCGWPTATSREAFNADGLAEASTEKGCGNVYVHGTYSQPLTIAAEDDLIIDGSIYPTSVAGKLGAAPAGTATLGLIAANYVRIYHPVRAGVLNRADECTAENLRADEDPNGWGAQPDIWIYGAMVAANHSFIVDNFACGSELGSLNIYGSIAANYRGAIGTGNRDRPASGYLKASQYDSRLLTDKPPYFSRTAPMPIPPGSVTAQPPNTVCVSRRHFIVHVVQIPGLVYRRIRVELDGHRIGTRTRKGVSTVPVDLRGLPKGTYVLRIMVETTHGRKISRTRTYHTCAVTPIHPKRPPRL